MPCSLPQLSVVSVGVNRFSCVRLFMTLWIIARQAPLSMGFSRQEYWSGLPFLLNRFNKNFSLLFKNLYIDFSPKKIK